MRARSWRSSPAGVRAASMSPASWRLHHPERMTRCGAPLGWARTASRPSGCGLDQGLAWSSGVGPDLQNHHDCTAVPRPRGRSRTPVPGGPSSRAIRLAPVRGGFPVHGDRAGGSDTEAGLAACSGPMCPPESRGPSRTPGRWRGRWAHRPVRGAPTDRRTARVAGEPDPRTARPPGDRSPHSVGAASVVPSARRRR
jgi:hypothetical protein